MTTRNQAEELIAKWITENPYRPSDAEARIVDTGIPVWAIIGHLPAAGGDLYQVAKDYDIDPDAVAAAIAYYRKHKAVIDARLALNASYAP